MQNATSDKSPVGVSLKFPSSLRRQVRKFHAAGVTFRSEGDQSGCDGVRRCSAGGLRWSVSLFAKSGGEAVDGSRKLVDSAGGHRSLQRNGVFDRVADPRDRHSHRPRRATSRCTGNGGGPRNASGRSRSGSGSSLGACCHAEARGVVIHELGDGQWFEIASRQCSRSPDLCRGGIVPVRGSGSCGFYSR